MLSRFAAIVTRMILANEPAAVGLLLRAAVTLGLLSRSLAARRAGLAYGLLALAVGSAILTIGWFLQTAGTIRF